LLITALIIFASLVVSVVFLIVVKQATDEPARQQANAFTGAVVAVIGTTYAVLLAFMLGGVWDMLGQAQANDEREATALINIYRISRQIKDPNAVQIQDICRKYAQNVIGREYLSLEQRGENSPEGAQMIDQLWQVMADIKVQSQNDAITIYQMMEELRNLTERRRLRAMNGREGLPGILWAVLLTGGAITIASTCFFGVSSFRLHVAQVMALTFLISLVLVAIADIDKPYQGPVRVQGAGFQNAIRMFGN